MQKIFGIPWSIQVSNMLANIQDTNLTHSFNAQLGVGYRWMALWFDEIEKLHTYREAHTELYYAVVGEKTWFVQYLNVLFRNSAFMLLHVRKGTM